MHVFAHAVRELRIGKIPARLREHRVRIPTPADLVGVDVVLLLPAELLAVRTVSEHALHVGALRPPADVVNLVQQLDRAFEGARTRRVRHHHPRRRGNKFREGERPREPRRGAALHRKQPHLHVAEAVVEERRRERLVARARERERAARDGAVVAARLLRDARLAGTKRNLRELDLHAAPARTLRDNGRHIRGVLSKIDGKFVVRYAHRPNRLVRLLQPAHKRRLPQLPLRRLRHNGRASVPASRHPMINIIPAIHVRAHHLALRDLPPFHRRLHDAADDELLLALAAHELRVEALARLRHVVHPVAERDLERVLHARLERGREHVVEARLRRARPAGEIELVAASDGLAVQRRDVLSETADRDLRGTVTVHLERRREPRRRRVQPLRLFNPPRALEEFSCIFRIRRHCADCHRRQGDHMCCSHYR